MRVKVFVKCDLAKLTSVLQALSDMEFVVLHHSRVQLEVIIGTIQQGRLAELRGVDGVLQVDEDVQFKTCSQGGK